MLESDEDLQGKTKYSPIISFRRNKNLRDELVRGRFNSNNKKNRNWLHDVAPKGNHTCGYCSFCKHMKTDKILRLGRLQHNVKQFVTCRSDFMVYAICCPCSFYYIIQGKQFVLYLNGFGNIYILLGQEKVPHG